MDNDTPKLQWSDVMWTNHGIYLTYQKTLKSVKDVLRTQRGECIRFDLSVFENPAKPTLIFIYHDLHWEYRGLNDKTCIQTILSNLHNGDPKLKLKYRVLAYKAII